MSQSSDPEQKESLNLESFEKRVAILFEELNLAIQWQRPSILLVIYDSEFVRKEAEQALTRQLSDLGQNICHLQVNKKQFDVPRILSNDPNRENTVYFITGLKWGGGRGGYNAYRALNLRRENFVDHLIRVVFWLTKTEGTALPKHAPDFWAFRHRVIEFVEIPVPRNRVFTSEGLVWGDRKPDPSIEDIDEKISFRELLLNDLTDKEGAQGILTDFLYDLAFLYWAKGTPERAIDLLKQGLRIAQQHQVSVTQSQFWVGLGINYSNMNNIPDALNACSEVIKLNPRDAGSWISLGNIYSQLGHDDNATSAYQKAVSINPKDSTGWNDLGKNYHNMGRINDAIHAYRESIEIDPKNPNPWNNIGSVYSDLGCAEDAIRAYKKAIKLNPINAGSWKNLGDNYHIMDRHPEAIIAYRKAIKIDPRDAPSYFSLAACYRKSGYTKKAAMQIKKGRLLIKQENEYNLACFESVTGNMEKSLVLLKTALAKKQIAVDRIRYEPNLDFVRDDLHFKKLLGNGKIPP